jgi:Raf kinase inhibitor-like YbhB/YbcL family protein
MSWRGHPVLRGWTKSGARQYVAGDPQTLMTDTIPNRRRRAGLALLIATSVLTCGWGPKGVAMAFELTSAAFKPGESIPSVHTCDGQDLSPPLAWTGPPPGTKRFALVCDDPDAPAGTWVHWLIYDIPAGTLQLPQGMAPTPILGDGSRQGINDFKRPGYGGPCPPRGKPHRYYFRLYAVDTPVGLDPGVTRAALDRAMQGHVLAKVELMGRYAR